MKVNVSLAHLPVINFSMQQNHVPVIRELKLQNTSGEEIDSLDIRITFDPAFADGCTMHVDRLAPDETVTLTDVAVKLSTSYLSNLTERIEGSIKVEVISGEEVIGTWSDSIAVLAFDQWGGLAVLPALLASFVTPNHPDITPLLKRASEILGKWTGSPALDEYQTKDPNRVKLQMAALFEAIAEREIAYSTVPANFEDQGQRVRLYGDILSGKLATCLDMTLLYAGCLEAIGIHPIVVFVRGHAFAGGWLVEETFADTVNDDVSLLTKRTAEGINEIILVETTMMNAGSDVSFDKAVARANNHLLDTDNFILFLDVKRARNGRIRPLPLRVERDGVYIVEVEQNNSRNADAPSELGRTTTVNEVDHIDVGKQTIWERKLLDLSLRNNLLNTRITKNTLQLISVNVNSLEDALAAGAEFRIMPKPNDWDNPLMSEGIYQSLNGSDPIIDLVKSELSQKRLYSYLNDEQLQRALTYLYRSSRLSIEENGANTLYLALGLLKWFETPSSTRPRFAPILLMPIEIIKRSASQGFIIRSRDEETVMNITLLELLRQDFGITIGGLETLPADDEGVDVTAVFNIMRRAIMNQSGWDVEEQAIIGNFSFSKFIMWNDIHNNADKLSRNKIVASLISGKLELDTDPASEGEIDYDVQFPAGTVALPIGADSSQFAAICEAVAEKSFILHGPPGTGKSQTITNIIANALYNGKKVLFVAEKMAALQVVQRRLEAIGLAPFCLELHSNKTKKSYILEQLKRTTEVLKKRSNEDFSIRATQINMLRSELNGYIKMLHRVYPAGLSLYDCIAGYSASPYSGEAVNLSFDALKSLSPSARAELTNKVSQLQAICILCGNPSEHPLRGIEITVYNGSLKSEAKECLDAFLVAEDAFADAARQFLNIIGYQFEDLKQDERKAVAIIAHILKEAQVLPLELINCASDQTVFDRLGEAVKYGSERDAMRDYLLNEFRPAILDWDYGLWETKWRESSSKWWLFRIFGQHKVKKQLKSLSNGRFSATKENVGNVFAALDTYHQRKSQIERLGDLSNYLGSVWNNGNADWAVVNSASEHIQMLNSQLVVLTKDISRAASLRRIICSRLEGGLRSFRDIYGLSVDSVVDADETLAARTEDVVRTLCAPAFGSLSLNEGIATANRWRDNLDLLHDRAAFNAQCGIIVGEGFGSFIKALNSGSVPADAVSSCFAKSFFRSYAEYILSQEPELNAFHGTLFDEKIARFKQFSAEFENLTREELYAKLAASLPALQKEASQSSEVGILQRNIRNGGRGTSIRRLFEQIPDLLTRMCPCMLMSPISVAQYIDAGRTPFDLVIFDEASQMPTSEAVGAIARGKNVVVVGDPKQMPPTSFFTSNSFDEDNADKEDLENILEDCLALSMPSKYLLWHYRSKHESLITFSNFKYYDNKLLTFPSPDDLSTKVGWVNVEGVYDRGRSRQNRAEAEAVVAEIERRLSDPQLSKRSIGVVTFNTNQQSLIEDLLNDLFARRPDLESIALGLEDPIFVKNLENVQGDERDVILFSIGYGPDKSGKIALNFGPLNRDGGCRRLNVAVSRARYEMKVFSTLRGDQIDLNRTSADGVADLKAFLEYAEKGRDYFTKTTGMANPNIDDLVESIAKALRSRGYDVKTNIGSSGYKIDLGIVDSDNPDKYIMGIICDGHQYASSPMANDRVVTQDSVLKMLGWTIYHVWSMDWWENDRKALSAIIDAVEAVKKGESIEPEPQLAVEEEAVERPVKGKTVLEGAAQETDSDARPYVNADLYQSSVKTDYLLSGMFDSRIVKKIAKVIEVEAPVSRKYLYRKLLHSYDITRTGVRLNRHIEELLNLVPYRISETDPDIIWSLNQNPEQYDIYRPKSDRDARDIAPEEYAVAIRDILREQVSLPLDSLKKETALRFGIGRLTDNVAAAVTRGIDYALRTGRIVEEDGRLKLPK